MPEYIERQAAINKIRYREKTYGCVGNTYSNVIKNLPAADVAPVVHSSWEEIKDEPYGVFDYHFKCKRCHGHTPPKAYVIAPDYCPNCGAVMDGKEETQK